MNSDVTKKNTFHSKGEKEHQRQLEKEAINKKIKHPLLRRILSLLGLRESIKDKTRKNLY